MDRSPLESVNRTFQGTLFFLVTLSQALNTVTIKGIPFRFFRSTERWLIGRLRHRSIPNVKCITPQRSSLDFCEAKFVDGVQCIGAPAPQGLKPSLRLVKHSHASSRRQVLHGAGHPESGSAPAKRPCHRFICDCQCGQSILRYFALSISSSRRLASFCSPVACTCRFRDFSDVTNFHRSRAGTATSSSPAASGPQAARVLVGRTALGGAQVGILVLCLVGLLLVAAKKTSLKCGNPHSRRHKAVKK